MIVGPLGDLAQVMLGPQLLDLHADDFSQAGGQLLRYQPLRRRKIEANKRDLERPIDALRRGAKQRYDYFE